MTMTEELHDKLQVSHNISEGQDDAEHHHRPHHLHLLPPGEGRGVALNFHVSTIEEGNMFRSTRQNGKTKNGIV